MKAVDCQHPMAKDGVEIIKRQVDDVTLTTGRNRLPTSDDNDDEKLIKRGCGGG